MYQKKKADYMLTIQDIARLTGKSWWVIKQTSEDEGFIKPKKIGKRNYWHIIDVKKYFGL